MDCQQGIITVRAAYAKNGESRSVPMNKVLTETLQVIRINIPGTTQAFCNRKGMPYRSFRTVFERPVRRADIQDLTFHDLRHTFASRLVMAKVDLPAVNELMGHKDIKRTLRYTHLSAEHKQHVARRLEPSDVQVPSMFTTEQINRVTSFSQVIDFPSLPR
jgi:site-specific recombinase XerD